MLRVSNTLSGVKEDFEPRDPSQVRVYVCGITPYDESHVGHGMSYVVFDVIRRYLEYRGYGVRLVQNFTDVDDKIIERAQALGISVDELAGRFIDRYFEDMEFAARAPRGRVPAGNARGARHRDDDRKVGWDGPCVPVERRRLLPRSLA